MMVLPLSNQEVFVKGYGDSASIDAFGRLRVANPTTIFDSKNIYDDPGLAANVENQPLLYDNQETSGGGTATAYNAAHSSSTLSVSNLTAGTRVRQTRRRFNYQPGKSQLVMNTFVIGSTATGITKREGNFDENDGLFLECSDAYYIVRRTSTSGSPVDNKVAQSAWNIDPMDGTGRSGITLDFTKTQIFYMDWEWLGVGRVRCGFVIDGAVYYAHQFLNTNVLDVVYMQTPNLPIRTEITNDGTGAADSITQICSTVISEGGTQDLGVDRAFSQGSTSLSTSGTSYLMQSLRLNANYLGLTTKIKGIETYSTSNGLHKWDLIFNPTYSATPTYTNVGNSGIDHGPGDGSITVSAGTLVDTGWGVGKTNITESITNALNLGSQIDGTQDTLALVVTPQTNSQTLYSAIKWKELL